jgi:hypothetical protein
MEVLFSSAELEGRVVSLEELKRALDGIVRASAEEFSALKSRKDIDRALPRLVVAATLAEMFGYSAIVLTDRELGSGLIIEARAASALRAR